LVDIRVGGQEIVEAQVKAAEKTAVVGLTYLLKNFLK
jgi:hypothetical protein